MPNPSHRYSSYDRNKEGAKLSGVIYLHDISQPRIEPVRENLAMLGRFCRDDVVKNVVLATTKWRDILGDEGQRREQQLSETYWKKMLYEGVNTARFMDSLESAWGIVDLIPKNQPVDALLIQEELETFRRRLLKFETQTGSAGGILSLLRSLLGVRRVSSSRIFIALRLLTRVSVSGRIRG